MYGYIFFPYLILYVPQPHISYELFYIWKENDG